MYAVNIINPDFSQSIVYRFSCFDKDQISSILPYYCACPTESLDMSHAGTKNENYACLGAGGRNI